MKRTIQVLILILLITLLFPAAAFASSSDVYTEGYFKYRVEKDSVTICDYFGKESEVTVPAMIVGNPVSKISKGAFADNSKVKKVNLPDTIMTIEEGAFASGIRIVYDSNTKNPVSSGAGKSEASKSGTSGASSGQSAKSANGQDGKSSGAGADTDSPSGSDTKSSAKSGASADDSQPGIEEIEAELDEADLDNASGGSAISKKFKEIADAKGYGVVIAGVVIIILALCGLGYYFWKRKKNKNETNRAKSS